MHLLKTLANNLRRTLWHPKIRVVLGFGISLAIAYVMVRDIDWSGLSVEFGDFPVGYAALSLFIFSVATAIRAYRWQVLFIGDKVPLHRLMLVQNAGIGLNSISPIRIVSEATQFVLLTIRYRVRGELVAATLGIQRVLDFVIGAILLGAGLMLLPSLKGFAPYVAGAGVLAVVSLITVPAVIWFGSRPGLTHLRLLASTSTSLRHLVKARVKLTWSFMLTLGYWLLLGLSAWILAYGMGIEVSLLVATLLVIGTLTFVALVPSLPASVGTFEFAVYYFLTSMGVGSAEALGFALIIHAILFLPPILIALVVFASWSLTGKSNKKLRENADGAPGLASTETPAVQPQAD